MKLLIRPAEINDAQSILDIYSPYIRQTVITFETEVPTLSEFSKRVETILQNYPYLVCETSGKIVGYAYASRHRERAAYRYSTDLSIYVDMAYRHQGIGKRLYAELFKALESYPYYTAYASITLPNESSVGLHKAFGFQKIGVYHNVGYKAGKWLDVGWFEKPLKPYATPEKGDLL